jgi:RNA polymerase sigma-70 factor (ECF subfamily)
MVDTAALDAFLKSVERAAYLTARYSLRNGEDAMDVVQDSMIKLCQQYSSRPNSEWGPLFFRILRNGIIDAQRRQATRLKLFPSHVSLNDDGEYVVPEAITPEPSLDRLVDSEQVRSQLESAILELPDRQREAFLLRTLDGLNVARTAETMGCTVGSVKTHYFRAIQSLRRKLSGQNI